jgi:hypothetical protein
VSVVVTEPAVSTSAHLLAAATSATVAGAIVTMVIPVNRLSYILLATGAYLDTSGRFQYFAEGVYTEDLASKEVSKTEASQVDVADVSSLEFGGSHIDEVYLSETFSKLLTFTRNFADVAALSEAQQFDLAKAVTDSLAIADLTALLTSKPFTDNTQEVLDTVALQALKAVLDAVAASDVSALGVTKPVSDAASVSDSTAIEHQVPKSDSVSAEDSTNLEPAKYVYDAAALSDAAVRAVDKALTDAVAALEFIAAMVEKPVADSTAVADASFAAFLKALTDGVGINDSADATDGLLFQTNKSFANVAHASDAVSQLLNAIKSDPAFAADAGSLVSQGYCDLTYFAEDYVGDTRTF